VIENAFFQYFVGKYRIDEIKFWHSNTDQEVDYIIQEQFAFEIKVDKSRFRKEKYLSFQKNYPDISLLCLDEHDAMVLGN
jgi:predicted AAA+ superfamily ATPase